MSRHAKARIFLIVFSVIYTFFLLSCAKEATNNRTEKIKIPSVNFLSVGQGDCCFIVLPDGKTMLIDCGEKTESNISLISAYIDAAGGEEIDYLFLSHTDSDHTGSAADIIRKYGVDTAYIPEVKNDAGYTAFRSAKEELMNCGAKIKISAIGEQVVRDDYFFCFLYPDNDSGYDEINYGDATAKDINATSSILYLEYGETKFVFTGDAVKGAEEKVVDNALSGVYYLFGSETDRVDLNGVDFLKVSHHGGKEEISDKFYEYLKPDNAVISVGALNNYGHPSIFTLAALEAANPEINVLRTDVLGTVSVDITGENSYKIITDADLTQN